MRPRVLLVVLVGFTIVSTGRAASAQPSLHAALGVGGAYHPFEKLATFDTPEMAPLFVQAEAGGSLGPIGSIAHAAHIAVLSGFTEGVQLAVMPSYLLFRRSSLLWAQFVRFGFPLVFWPDTAYGVELGLGGVYFLRAGIGIVLEGNVDYYRGIENEVNLGGRIGAFFSYEILPRS